MGQKVNPLGFRLGISQKHYSEWFAKKNKYSELVMEDHFIRKYLTEKFLDAGIISILIKRRVDQIKLEICASRPRILMTFANQDLETLREELTEKLANYRQNFLTRKEKSLPITTIIESVKISIHLTKLANPNTSASFIADSVVEQLEKRIAFRRAMKSAIQRAQRAEVKGIKIQVSGRLNGAEIARSEWVRKGRVPLQTLRARVEYSSKTAKTIYGLLGIKVWVFQGLEEDKIKSVVLNPDLKIAKEL